MEYMNQGTSICTTSAMHLQSWFAALQSWFAALQSPFAALQSWFAALQSWFAALQSPFAALQNRLLDATISIKSYDSYLITSSYVAVSESTPAGLRIMAKTAATQTAANGRQARPPICSVVRPQATSRRREHWLRLSLRQVCTGHTSDV